MGISRLGHIEMRVTDLNKAVEYYTEMMGLQETYREEGRVFLKCWDEHEHHSLILKEAEKPGVEHFAFKLELASDLDYFEKKLTAAGVAVTRHAAGSLEKGQGEVLRFLDPGKHVVELYFAMEKVGNGLSKVNPHATLKNLKGIAPPRLDHLLETASDVDAGLKFYTELLEFRLVERALDGEGNLLAVWLTRTPTTHDLAILRGNDGGIHHFSFWLDDWNDVRKAADLMVLHDVFIDAGPTRHGITRGNTIYFFDTSGNRAEVYTGGYWVDYDHEPITWTADALERGIFAYERVINARFTTVST